MAEILEIRPPVFALVLEIRPCGNNSLYIKHQSNDVTVRSCLFFQINTDS